MKSKLLTIGELSKRTGCSIKALRYYDLIGLLKPVYVDPNSNYRYYNFEQTRMVELIQICINLSIKHDYSVIINIKDGIVTKFVACEVYKIDSNIENIIKVKEGTFLCKKTSSFNFDDICDMFSDVGCSDKTIIISPGYNYDFSSPYFEVKCTV